MSIILPTLLCRWRPKMKSRSSLAPCLFCGKSALGQFCPPCETAYEIYVLLGFPEAREGA